LARLTLPQLATTINIIVITSLSVSISSLFTSFRLNLNIHHHTTSSLLITSNYLLANRHLINCNPVNKVLPRIFTNLKRSLDSLTVDRGAIVQRHPPPIWKILVGMAPMAVALMGTPSPAGALAPVKCTAEASSQDIKTKWDPIWDTLLTARWCLSAMANLPALTVLAMEAKEEACMI
jgi:hypothetical protein